MLEELVGTGVEYRAEMLRLALIEARGTLNLTQTELARAAGVPRYIVNNYETDAVPLYRTENLTKLADALGIDLDEYGYMELPQRAAREAYKRRPRVHKKPPSSLHRHYKFGRALQQVRLRQGFTQETAAVEIGISPTSLAEWELGSVIPSVKNLTKWAVFFGVDADAWLKAREEEKK